MRRTAASRSLEACRSRLGKVVQGLLVAGKHRPVPLVVTATATHPILAADPTAAATTATTAAAATTAATTAASAGTFPPGCSASSGSAAAPAAAAAAAAAGSSAAAAAAATGNALLCVGRPRRKGRVVGLRLNLAVRRSVSPAARGGNGDPVQAALNLGVGSNAHLPLKGGGAVPSAEYVELRRIASPLRACAGESEAAPQRGRRDGRPQRLLRVGGLAWAVQRRHRRLWWRRRRGSGLCRMLLALEQRLDLAQPGQSHPVPVRERLDLWRSRPRGARRHAGILSCTVSCLSLERVRCLLVYSFFA